MQVSAWLCALSGPSLCQPLHAREQRKKEQALNASFPTCVPMRVLWIHWSAPALQGASVGAFIWATRRPLRRANRALLGGWCGQGSARRQRPVPLSISRAELPSCGQNAVESNPERRNTSGGNEEGVLRRAYADSQVRLWAKSGNKPVFSS